MYSRARWKSSNRYSDLQRDDALALVATHPQADFHTVIVATRQLHSTSTFVSACRTSIFDISWSSIFVTTDLLEILSSQIILQRMQQDLRLFLPLHTTDQQRIASIFYTWV